MPKAAIAVLLSLLTSVLLLAAQPKFDLRFLAPIALTPLLFALARTPKLLHRFFLGWAAGIVYWFCLCIWIQFVLQAHGGMGGFGSWASFCLFALFKGLHLAVFAALAGPLVRQPYAVFAVAALWTGLERTHATFGFTWLQLGNAGIDMSVPLRLAPFVGVYGLSFVFAMLATALASVALRQPRLRLLPLITLPMLVLLPAIPQNWPAKETAVIVQPNIDTEQDWTSAAEENAERQLTLLSNVLPVSLVIWPELPAPLYFYSDPEFHHQAEAIATRHGYFLFGTVAYKTETEPLNSAVLLGRDGAELGRYDKINLVPFGEFVPPVFSFVNRISHETGDFIPGTKISVLNAGTQRLGVFICYEAAFPELVRQFTAQGANVLVNLTNDGYFGHSEARLQHLNIARMRAVENRRWLIRSTNDGYSAIIDPAGRITQTLPPYEQLAAPVHYSLIQDQTFYSTHGDWFVWSCLVIGLSLGLYNLTKSGRAKSGRAKSGRR